MRVSSLLVALAVCTIAPARAHASIWERLLDVGRKMRPYLDDDKLREKPRQVRINGVTLEVATGHSDDPPVAVRAWYGSVYRADGTFDRLGKEAARQGKHVDAGTLNQLQFGDDEEGGLLAIDFGGPLSAVALAQRLERFAKSGELGVVGAVRFVYVKRAPGGGTQYLTMWTDERFSLYDLVPDGRSDAPGADLDDVPRLPGGVRLLSVAERGMPQRLVVYSVAGGSAEGAELFYRARMRTLGWTPHDDDAGRSDGRRRLLRYARDGHELIVSVSPSRDGERVVVSLLETR